MPAFSSLETHPFSGQPINLFEFLRTSGGTEFYWRYTNADRNLWYNGVEWKAIPISYDGIRISTEAASTDLSVTMPISEDFCSQFRLGGSTPSDTVWLRIRRVHASNIVGLDGPTPTIQTSALVVWIGTVNGITQPGELEATIRCSMLSASFRRGGLRYGYQKNCPHVLYNQTKYTCLVNKEDYRITGPVMAIAGNTVTVENFGGQTSGWFSGGFIEYSLPTGMLERRMVTDHSGETVTLMGLPVGMAEGDIISAFPGCDRTVVTCRDKFHNLANFGGFPHSPGRNPFDGNPVF